MGRARWLDGSSSTGTTGPSCSCICVALRDIILRPIWWQSYNCIFDWNLTKAVDDLRRWLKRDVFIGAKFDFSLWRSRFREVALLLELCFYHSWRKKIGSRICIKIRFQPVSETGFGISERSISASDIDDATAVVTIVIYRSANVLSCWAYQSLLSCKRFLFFQLLSIGGDFFIKKYDNGFVTVASTVYKYSMHRL